ncbi:MAG: DUF559 domain-containing protein [Chloroflexi bacterium]|nr:DUF559 domain-containing protein [Chloroflexota bacterium]
MNRGGYPPRAKPRRPPLSDRRRPPPNTTDTVQEVLRARDAERAQWLEGEGYRVLRFWNNDVLHNLNGVMLVIREALGTPPHPNLLPPGEKESGT